MLPKNMIPPMAQKSAIFRRLLNLVYVKMQKWYTLPQNMILSVAQKSDIFSPTTQFSIYEDANVMYTSSKYDSPCGAEIRYFFADYSI